MSRWNFYSDNDEFCVEWIRNLIKGRLIPDGEVDNRSVLEIVPEDLIGFRQVHFCCGIAGWPLALRMAGYEEVPDLWTASVPCQPISVSGKRLGADDERHLWPVVGRLIQIRRPTVVLGEQVSGDLGRQWLSGVRLDLEQMGYGVGAADLCSAGVNAPNIRQRIYWMGYSDNNLRKTWGPSATPSGYRDATLAAGRADSWLDIAPGGGRPRADGAEQQPAGTGDGCPQGDRLGDPSGAGLPVGVRDGGVPGEAVGRDQGEAAIGGGVAGRLADTDNRECGGVSDRKGCDLDGAPAGRIEGDGIAESGSADFDVWDQWVRTVYGRVANAEGTRYEGSVVTREVGGSDPCIVGTPRTGSDRSGLADADIGAGRQGSPDRSRSASGDRPESWSRSGRSFYDDFDLVQCSDGYSRRFEPGSFPLAARVPIGLGAGRSRVEQLAISTARTYRKGTLRGYGNAINPIVAAQFIAVAMSAIEDNMGDA